MFSSEEFIGRVKELVRDYTNEHLDISDNSTITTDNVYIVWYCKALKNHKALASTTLTDGMYYEITYNGDTDEIYFDAYKKFQNKCIDCYSSKKYESASDEELLEELASIQRELDSDTSMQPISYARYERLSRYRQLLKEELMKRKITE